MPFYWWQGDPLTRERFRWQLDKLQEAGVQGFSVSYAHGHRRVDHDLVAAGFRAKYLTLPSDPPFMSPAWWELWDWFAGECVRRGMGVGLGLEVLPSSPPSCGMGVGMGSVVGLGVRLGVGWGFGVGLGTVLVMRLGVGMGMADGGNERGMVWLLLWI